MTLFIGLMSGTSMDGIDAALVDMSSNRLIHGITWPYSQELVLKLREAMSDQTHSPGFYSQLNTLIGREFGQAALHLLHITQTEAKHVRAIGSHGQTICHDPQASIPYTVQLGCAHTIAEMTGITVVADFRTRDLIVGGQGAPFAPIWHHALFRDQSLPLAVVNIGGIANVSLLLNDKEVYGHDLGPGNCLMDAFIMQHQQVAFDRDGAWAASGQVIDTLLDDLLGDPWFRRPPPKSIGKEYFSLSWLTQYDLAAFRPCDVQATLLQLTAHSIASGIQALPLCPSQLLLCGGGVHNQTLFDALAHLLPDTAVNSTRVYDINPDFIEAHMLAWLAEKNLNMEPLDLNTITGARYPVILGAIYPRGIDNGNS